VSTNSHHSFTQWVPRGPEPSPGEFFPICKGVLIYPTPSLPDEVHRMNHLLCFLRKNKSHFGKQPPSKVIGYIDSLTHAGIDSFLSLQRHLTHPSHTHNRVLILRYCSNLKSQTLHTFTHITR